MVGKPSILALCPTIAFVHAKSHPDVEDSDLRASCSRLVDDQLRVHGVEGLRVIDASIMPLLPSANTFAATIAIAERGADLVRGRGPAA